MGKQVHLPIYHATEVTSVNDMFSCTPYAATIRAEACLKRQLRMVEMGAKMAPGQSGSKIQGDYERCRKCALGEAIKTRLPKAKVVVKALGKQKFITPSRKNQAVPMLQAKVPAKSSKPGTSTKPEKKTGAKIDVANRKKRQAKPKTRTNASGKSRGRVR